MCQKWTNSLANRDLICGCQIGGYLEGEDVENLKMSLHTELLLHGTPRLVQVYVAHNKQPPLLAPQYDPRYSPAVGS